MTFTKLFDIKWNHCFYLNEDRDINEKLFFRNGMEQISILPVIIIVITR